MILTPFEKEDFIQILMNYNIGNYIKHKHVFVPSNTVYILETTKGKFILKIFEQASEDFIKFQMRILDYLSGKGVRVQEVAKTRNNELLMNYNGKRLAILYYLEGGHPKKMTQVFIKSFAQGVSLMHKHIINLKLKGGDEWGGVGHQFRNNDFFTQTTNKYMQEENKALIKELNENVNKDKLRISIIHSDLYPNNLLSHKGLFNGFIDWDDSHWDYLCYDIAVAITYYGTNKKRIKTFLKSYQEIMHINNEEKKAIYYFIKNRLIGSHNWSYKQMMIHKDKMKEFKKYFNKTIKDYVNFSKINLEEFLNLY